MTVEDPVEYMHRRHQPDPRSTPRSDMTFARGLRSILRQDPDVIMVGEIRDLETAEIAVQASLTGHLVLQHAAHQRRARRRHPPVTWASSRSCCRQASIGVLAQRLVRVLDPDDPECPMPRPSTSVACSGSTRRIRRRSQSGHRGEWRAAWLQGPHRHLRARDDRRPNAHDDPRRRPASMNSNVTPAPIRARAFATTG